VYAERQDGYHAQLRSQQYGLTKGPDCGVVEQVDADHECPNGTQDVNVVAWD
jgi:hypothetical protein